jgi:hypothetical protein
MNALERLRLAAGHRAFITVLAWPCSVHDAAAGEPCWRLPSGYPTGNTSMGLCGRRLTQAKEARTR